MVILKNIKKTKTDISANYYIEGREPKGFMKMRISDEEIIVHNSVGYGSSHVKYELERLAKLDKLPAKKQYFGFDTTAQKDLRSHRHSEII